MIKSMTGYGRGENIDNNCKFTVEIKSVNHRYNDISIKLPRSMNYIEDKIRKRLMENIFRGKTDVFINFESYSADDICIKLNEALANAYVQKLSYLKEKFGLVSGNTLDIVVRFPEVITTEKTEQKEDIIWNILFPAIDLAVAKFTAMRAAEGEALKNDIIKKTEIIKYNLKKIKERAPFVAVDYKNKLESRLKEAIGNFEIDQQRLTMELTIFSDKCCIDEEITRLESHINQLEGILETGGLVGRKLDFLVQEMNRESNTIASKANDIEVTKATIDLKSEIEKIREQVQNIE